MKTDRSIELTLHSVTIQRGEVKYNTNINQPTYLKDGIQTGVTELTLKYQIYNVVTYIIRDRSVETMFHYVYNQR